MPPIYREPLDIWERGSVSAAGPHAGRQGGMVCRPLAGPLGSVAALPGLGQQGDRREPVDRGFDDIPQPGLRIGRGNALDATMASCTRSRGWSACRSPGCHLPPCLTSCSPGGASRSSSSRTPRRSPGRPGLGVVWVSLAVAFIALQPHDGEVFFSITNSQWVLGLALALYIGLPEPDPGWVEVGALAIACVTGPFAVMLLPILLLQAALRRDFHSRWKTYLVVGVGAGDPALRPPGFESAQYECADGRHDIQLGDGGLDVRQFRSPPAAGRRAGRRAVGDDPRRAPAGAEG